MDDKTLAINEKDSSEASGASMQGAYLSESANRYESRAQQAASQESRIPKTYHPEACSDAFSSSQFELGGDNPCYQQLRIP